MAPRAEARPHDPHKDGFPRGGKRGTMAVHGPWGVGMGTLRGSGILATLGAFLLLGTPARAVGGPGEGLGVVV